MYYSKHMDKMKQFTFWYVAIEYDVPKIEQEKIHQAKSLIHKCRSAGNDCRENKHLCLQMKIEPKQVCTKNNIKYRTKLYVHRAIIPKTNSQLVAYMRIRCWKETNWI